jgi:TonB family protein
MNTVGLGAAFPFAQRVAVIAAVGSLHVLIVYLLNIRDVHYNMDDGAALYAEVLPTDRRISEPPSFPDIVFQAHARITLPTSQLSVDDGAQQAFVSTPGQLTEPELPAAQISDAPAVEVDRVPVLSPRPVSGPKGSERIPGASLKAKESGTVVMNICVSPIGRVDSVALTHSSGFPRLDAVALGIASEYRFEPAKRLGHPVAACELYRIVFKLS